MSELICCLWGEAITLEYGKPIRDYKQNEGNFPVFGSNGQIGWTHFPLVEGPGIILGRKGAYRGIHYSKSPFSVIDTAYYVLPKRADLDVRWLFYAMKFHKLGEINDGSPIPSTTRSAVYVRTVSVPPLPEQRRIAHILGTLDDKIELNRRMNATLEAMARALFKSWFVDFDPVRAKQQGRQPTGMDAATAELFPSEFEESELGPIPKGWCIVQLKEFAILYTQSVAPYKFPDRLFRHYSIPAYDNSKIPTVDWGASIKSNKYIVKANAVLVSKLNPQTPRIWLPSTVGENQICSTEFMQFVPHVPTGRSFLYCLMNSQPMLDSVASHVTGSTGSRQRAQPSAIADLKTCLPNKNLLQMFGQRVAPLLDLVASNLSDQTLLADIRDKLLPKLLSGRLDLPTSKGNQEPLHPAGAAK